MVPNLDALIDAKDLAGFARVGVDVTFDAYVRAGSNPEEATVATAHSHGLAQCKRFIAEHRLRPVPAPSNAAACRDIKANEIALGPSICGELYNLSLIHIYGTARLVSRQEGVMSGIAVFEAAFAAQNPTIRVLDTIKDGERFEAGQTLAEVEGPVRDPVSYTHLDVYQRQVGSDSRFPEQSL